MLDDLRDRYGSWRLLGGPAAVVVLIALVAFVFTRGTGTSLDTDPSSPTTAPLGPINTLGSTGDPEPPAVTGTPAVPPGAFVNDRGSYFSTFSAPAETMAWTQSTGLLFNQPLPADTPLAPDSAEIAARIDQVVRGQRLYDYASGIEDDINSPVMVLVDSDVESFTPVRFRPDDCGATDQRWWNWTAEEFEPYINGAYASLDKVGVPLPAGFKMREDDSDFHLVIYDWRRDTMIELWRAKTENVSGQPGLQVCWGGIVKHYAAQGTGIFPFPMGVAAAGTSAVGLTITMNDIQQGEIRHAVAVSAQFGLNDRNGTTHSYPANRNDGGCSDVVAAVDPVVKKVTDAMDGARYCIREGQRLRLPPDYPVDSLPTPFARMVAKAIRDYGLVLVDDAGCFCLQAESGVSVTQNGFGSTSPWDQLFNGTNDTEVMLAIDWTKLQVLPADWGRPEGYQIVCAGPVGTGLANPVGDDARCQAKVPAYSSG